MTEIKPWEIRGDGNTLEERAGWMLTEIHELRAALAKSQPVEQGEPVAYIWHGHMGTGSKSLRFSKPSQWDYTNAVEPLFTHPVRPMSDEQIQAAFGEEYKTDLALLQLSRENKDYAVEAIGARHHFAAFKTAIKSAEAFHGIKGATE